MPPVSSSALPAGQADEPVAGDSTDYRATLYQLRQGYCRLALLSDEPGGPVTDCLFLEINPAFTEHTSLPAGVVGHTLRELRPETEAHWLALLGEAAHTGQVQHVERQTRLFGTRWLEVDVLPSGRSAAGRPQVAVLLSDITSRRQAEEALQTAYGQLAGVLENTSDAFYDLDAQLRFTYVNRRAGQLWGREPQLLIGQFIWTVFYQAVGSEAYQQHQHVLQTGQPVQFEATSPVLGNWLEINIYPNQVGGLSVFFRDSTARRLAGQQQQVAAVLGGQEEERRRIAESLHNGIGQLLYAAKLQLDLLPHADESGWAEARHLLDEAIRQTRAVSHELTSALLADFGLQVALETICRQLTSPDLQWHCYFDLAESPALPAALQQAVYRLVQGLAHNVARHAQASEATIEVVVLLTGWLVLHLEDNGRGFDPATVREGLGLRTLRSRAALLGGTVQIDSAPGQGTRIELRLPLV